MWENMTKKNTVIYTYTFKCVQSVAVRVHSNILSQARVQLPMQILRIIYIRDKQRDTILKVRQLILSKESVAYVVRAMVLPKYLTAQVAMHM